MLNLSLRAVFRKESWIFCAGLLLSIADLLKFLDLRHSNLHPRQPPWALKPTACSSRTFRSRTRGDNLLPRRPISQAAPHAGSCEYDTASPHSFQPGTCGNRLFLHNVKICHRVRPPFHPQLCTIPGVGDSVPRVTLRTVL